MDGMKVESSNRSEQSNSGDAGLNADSNTQLDGGSLNEAMGGKLDQFSQDLNSGDPLKKGNAMQDVVKKLQEMLEKLGIKPPGEEEAGPAPAGAAPPPAAPAAEAPAGEEAPSFDDIIKMLAEALGIPEEQLEQALKQAQGAESGEDTGTTAPTEAETV